MQWFNFDKLPASKGVWPGETNYIFHTEKVTLMKFTGKKGYVFSDKGHKQEQVTVLLKGEFKFTVEGETRIMKEWGAVFIAPMEKHGGEALTDVMGIDIFFPKRKEKKYRT